MNKVLSTFQSFMEDALKKSLPELTLNPSEEPSEFRKVLSARLCFEGKDMKAQAFLSCTEDFLQLTCPLPRGSENHSEDVIQDWLGELGNLILGRLKNRLLAHDVTIKISAPDFGGDWIRPTQAEDVSVWFECEGTLIGFECLVEGRVPEIGEALTQSAEILPGDAIYRLNDTVHAAETVDLLSKIRAGVEDIALVDEAKSKAKIEIPAEPQAAERKPFQIHFHNADSKHKKSQESLPAADHGSVLDKIAWPSIDNLELHFSSGLEMTVSPKTLLEKGTSRLEVEGLVLEIKREGDVLRLSVPKLAMALSKKLK